jgi:menaquinol-cytochrome c reductase iron-sulfur subunit
VSSHNDKSHVPSPSLWPVGFAVGVVCLLLGLVLSSWIIAAVGAVLGAVFAYLWVRDLTRDIRPVDAPAPGAAVAASEPEAEVGEEPPAYSRSVFLEGATLGLGAAIGGLVTLPVLGFAVLPAFESHKAKDVDLGPISNFPEQKWIVATFLEDPSQGEVSRKTAFIRNNGTTTISGKPEPSFTILYSRCAHLGCPIQPNGIVADTKKIEVKGSTLIPAFPAGFGCPCHGGQYDNEGNRIAGPPVRSLDRFAYSIVHGNLVLGTLYSVGHVEGTGGDAKISRFTSAFPGVHVDGVEKWLYPIPVPGR